MHQDHIIPPNATYSPQFNTSKFIPGTAKLRRACPSHSLIAATAQHSLYDAINKRKHQDYANEMISIEKVRSQDLKLL